MKFYRKWPGDSDTQVKILFLNTLAKLNYANFINIEPYLESKYLEGVKGTLKDVVFGVCIFI